MERMERYRGFTLVELPVVSSRKRAAFTLVELPVVSLRKRAAFTLVELLVVIGIIAVLIGILIPALSRARESSIRIKCASNLRQIGIAAMNYAAENKGILPDVRSNNPHYVVNRVN